MKITRLRLLGFKSFVEPTELVIQGGLTGVVGPNGCGKSNLLEGIRWAMGETSYKSMRGSAMDDVIFAGSEDRPARNTAEVTLFIDNADRTAPAEFNDNDALEITRRIERDSGSAYRVNGKDARARDVRLLFEDAATGARSPALVRQGRIGEIVNAPPEERRRVIEDAAGIAGLHSRRHEAELRLKAAEGNLERLGDLIGQLGTQLQALKRQARQAQRYKEISVKIRETEALHHHLHFVAACALVEQEEAALQTALSTLADETRAEGEALRAHNDAADRLQPLREEEAARAAALHRLSVEREALEREAQQAKTRQAELETRLAQAKRDLTREEEQIADAQGSLKQLEDELRALKDASETDDEEPRLKAAVEAASEVLKTAEQALSAATTELAQARAERRRLEAEETDLTGRITRLEAQTRGTAEELAKLEAASGGAGVLDELNTAAETLVQTVEAAETKLSNAEVVFEQARAAEGEQRSAASAAKLARQELETELATLTKLLKPANEGGWQPVIEQLTVRHSYEQAIGAALGDDLDAASDEAAPAHWRLTSGEGDDPALPDGIPSLAEFVQAPEVLTRRLKQIGVVDPAHGQALQPQLQTGQRLVSRDGDLWRWDGYSLKAGAATAAGQRLIERNRLATLKEQAAAAERRSAEAEEALGSASLAAGAAEAEIKTLRQELKSAQGELTATRNKIAEVERARQAEIKRIGALTEAKERGEAAIAEARERLTAIEASIAGLTPIEMLETTLSGAQTKAGEAREAHMLAKADLEGLTRAIKLRQDRIAAIGTERISWETRVGRAREQIETLKARHAETEGDLAALADIPAQIEQRRSGLMDAIATAGAERRKAADDLALAETAVRDCDKALKAVQERLTAAREARARSETRLESARERRSDSGRQIREQLDCAPEECLALAGAKPDSVMPELSEIEARLTKLRADRERLGGVNLRAEEEETELSAKLEEMERERADVEEAIARLRQGISSLNREGRKRLLDAFETVDGHFKRLFQTLFNGGSAELKLIDADDPLQSGLEIYACPPGKRPQTLTLLSGGEKALTALALVFAVFLTNPSPICVLDEVDAPLDDANVERFCLLMEEMARTTDTRFLIITHSPLTMARMERLFGVTMSERGVSQLVSVDLETAEKLRDAS